MISAGLSNIIGISIFSKFFSNGNLSKFDSLFDTRGNILIVLWGLTYIFTKNTYKNPIMLVFFLEKILYFINYISTLKTKSKKLKSLWKKDKLTSSFIYIYGIIDLIFGIIFLYLFFKN